MIFRSIMLGLIVSVGLAGCSDNTELELRHQASLAKALNDENRQQGEQFLRENETRSGIQVLPGGVQYKVLSSGHGATPGALDSVTVDYEGSLIDGTIFDSTWQRGEPASFQVNKVIRGWTHALMRMKEGDDWMLYIPAD
ncbi:MAG: FKBP-type peptidyl-prolyl cis-trans isomerase, partial [Marinobacterium sp.]|nr:FKBP-type peptidyl-prolyl cis-trans isomerase [Marinobacterium sp.]